MNKLKLLSILGLFFILSLSYLGLSSTIVVPSHSLHPFSADRKKNLIDLSEVPASITNFAPLPALVSHVPISINGNAQISSYASSGTGTSSDPYIIQDLNVTHSGGSLIKIYNTNMFITIKNNFFDAENIVNSIAFDLTNNTNIVLDNNLISNCNYGINSLNGSKITIENNIFQISFPSPFGIVGTLNNTIITGNSFSLNSGVSIELEEGNKDSVTNNQITNDDIAIFMPGGDSNTISGNDITNTTTYSIELKLTTNTLVKDNTVLSSGIYGIVLAYSDNNLVLSNSVDGTQYLIYDLTSINNEINGNILKNAQLDGILIEGYGNNTNIINNSVFNSNFGIVLSYTVYVNLQNNIISNSQFEPKGLYVFSSNFDSFRNFTISNSTIDCDVEFSYWNNLTSFNLLGSGTNGTLIFHSSYNTISQSIFSNGFDFGLSLINGTSNRVISNKFEDANYYAVFLADEIGAAVQNNQFLGQGHFSGTQAFDSGIDTLFLNNYWNGFKGPDANNDGIIDNPVIIDGPAHSKDLAPLMTPNGQSLPSKIVTVTFTVSTNSNNSTTTPGKQSPGFTVFFLLGGLLLISFLAILKRKKFRQL